MAEKWYPIIDKKKCIKCHNCIDFCPHEVFEVDDEGYPEVVNFLDCVEFCRGCLNACDEDAISYYGDD